MSAIIEEYKKSFESSEMDTIAFQYDGGRVLGKKIRNQGKLHQRSNI